MAPNFSWVAGSLGHRSALNEFMRGTRGSTKLTHDNFKADRCTHSLATFSRSQQRKPCRFLEILRSWGNLCGRFDHNCFRGSSTEQGTVRLFQTS